MAPRLPLVGALLLVLAVSGEAGAAPRLRGSVSCLDCPAGHDLSGVVVAVKCAGEGLLRAAQTDGRGAFDVEMPAAASPTPCAARVLGGTEQLCAPRGLTVARVVTAGQAPGSSSSYALDSRLAVFTRCRPATDGRGGSAAAATTMDAPDHQQQQGRPAGAGGEAHSPAVQTPVVGAPPRAGGNAASPPFGMGSGVPLIYFFPFVPIIGIP